MNEKRSNIGEIEERHRVQVIIVPDPNLETPHFNVERTRDEGKEVVNQPSYELIPQQEMEANLHQPAPIAAEQPAVKSINSATPAPRPQQGTKAAKKPGILARFFSWIADNEADQVPEKPNKPHRSRKRSRNNRDYNRRNRSGGNNRRRGNNQNRRRNDNARRASSHRNRNNDKHHSASSKNKTSNTTPNTAKTSDHSTSANP